jgi:abortive infection bacteriophage resistance protein
LKTSFLKSHLSYEKQIELLQNRNLTIVNRDFAIKKLQHLNYYRLSSYYYPFYETKDWFKTDTTFENILQLYYFDKDLRHLIFFAIEKIEIYIRTQISFTISKHNEVFGYTDKNIFHSETFHSSILETITSETNRSKEIFVKEFFNTYDEEYLPVWSMVEIISFNTLSKIFANLKESYRQEIVKDIDVKPFVFQRWLHTLTYIRNICAHHSRLWNKILAIEPMVPKNQKLFKTIDNNKVFFVLTMIEYILIKIDSEEFSFKYELKQLLKRYPSIDKKAMGFVENWEELEIWRDDE